MIWIIIIIFIPDICQPCSIFVTLFLIPQIILHGRYYNVHFKSIVTKRHLGWLISYSQKIPNPCSFQNTIETDFPVLTFYLFIHKRQRERQRHRQREKQGDWRGTRSQASRITPWAKAGTPPLSHPAVPRDRLLLFQNL